MIDRLIRVMDRIHESPVTQGSRAAVTTGVGMVVGGAAVAAGIFVSLLVQGISRWTN